MLKNFSVMTSLFLLQYKYFFCRANRLETLHSTYGGLEHTAALDAGVWYNTVREGGCRFMAAWTKKRGKGVRTPAEE